MMKSQVVKVERKNNCNINKLSIEKKVKYSMNYMEMLNDTKYDNYDWRKDSRMVLLNSRYVENSSKYKYLKYADVPRNINTSGSSLERKKEYDHIEKKDSYHKIKVNNHVKRHNKNKISKPKMNHLKEMIKKEVKDNKYKNNSDVEDINDLLQWRNSDNLCGKLNKFTMETDEILSSPKHLMEMNNDINNKNNNKSFGKLKNIQNIKPDNKKVDLELLYNFDDEFKDNTTDINVNNEDDFLFL